MAVTGRAIPRENLLVAERLREASQLMSARGANPYSVNAYRQAANAIARLPRDVRALYENEGVRGLDAIPHVGLGIASAVEEMLVSHRWSRLERLRGEVDTVTLLQSVPGIGPGLARRIHAELGIDSLEALEIAATDGRLDRIPGLGARRVAVIRATLGEMLGGARMPPAEASRAEAPPLDTLLDIDREYRHKAATGELRLIAPKRFNPDGVAWLPILHTTRDKWHFTALYSNTALAHRLGRIHDWVVVYFHDGETLDRSHTIVTEHRGPLAGKRVVRGRESECLAYYASH